MSKIERKRVTAWRRTKRSRKNTFGWSDRPRLSVFRSHKHIYAQIIDDLEGKTLCAASSANREIAEQHQLKHGGDVRAAEAVGTTVAQRAIMKGIKKVVFDRGPYQFHGRVKALAEAARKAGLEF